MVAVFCAARSAAGFGALLDMAVGGDLYGSSGDVRGRWTTGGERSEKS